MFKRLYFLSLRLSHSACPDFFCLFSPSSVVREKSEDPSCQTTTARTPKGIQHSGRSTNLRQGRTGANGASG